jgi:16S rRNA (guanine527-N7)-methyltransferase
MIVNSKFIDFFPGCGVKDIDSFVDKITKFKNYLSQENKKHNLTRIESDDDFWNKHICDSLSIAKVFPEMAREKFSIIDIGCGAGFPSFVLAAAFENLTITAIDSVGKKTEFLNRASEIIGLNNLKVSHVRSREYKTEEKFDIITARAVGEVYKIFKDSKKLLRDGGRYLLYKTPENIDEDLFKTNKLSKKLKFTWERTEDFSLPAGDGKRLFVIGKHIDD